MYQEIESLKKEKMPQGPSSESLLKELERKLESLNFEKNEEQTQMLEKIKQLEDEKNALLDYIEENIEKQSCGVISPMFNANSAGGNPRIISSEVNQLKQRLEEMEHQNAKLLSDLEEAQKLLYQSAQSKHMQENTFGQIIPQGGNSASSQVMSPLESMQLRGIFESGKYAEVLRDNEEMAKKISVLEDSEARIKLEKQQLLDRISRLEQDSDLRVDEVMHENQTLIR